MIKIKSSEQMHSAITPMAVFDRSLTDVSFLSDMLVDKFVYHMPLCRQHQRLAGAGITLSCATLTNLVRRSIDLLEPIVNAQLSNALVNRVFAMDETPIKAWLHDDWVVRSPGFAVLCSSELLFLAVLASIMLGMCC